MIAIQLRYAGLDLIERDHGRATGPFRMQVDIHLDVLFGWNRNRTRHGLRQETLRSIDQLPPKWLERINARTWYRKLQADGQHVVTIAMTRDEGRSELCRLSRFESFEEDDPNDSIC